MRRSKKERFKAIRSFARRYVSKRPKSEEWWAVRALIPTSHFTKKGPGVRAQAMAAFRDMTPGQREVAVKNGWF